MFALPDFRSDIEGFREDLTAIRRLLEQLVAIEENKGKK
jgi:hypothetical protein